MTQILDLSKLPYTISNNRIREIAERTEVVVNRTSSRAACARVIENALREVLMEVGVTTQR